MKFQFNISCLCRTRAQPELLTRHFSCAVAHWSCRTSLCLARLSFLPLVYCVSKNVILPFRTALCLCTDLDWIWVCSVQKQPLSHQCTDHILAAATAGIRGLVPESCERPAVQIAGLHQPTVWRTHSTGIFVPHLLIWGTTLGCKSQITKLGINFSAGVTLWFHTGLDKNHFSGGLWNIDFFVFFFFRHFSHKRRA